MLNWDQLRDSFENHFPEMKEMTGEIQCEIQADGPGPALDQYASLIIRRPVSEVGEINVSQQADKALRFLEYVTQSFIMERSSPLNNFHLFDIQGAGRPLGLIHAEVFEGKQAAMVRCRESGKLIFVFW